MDRAAKKTLREHRKMLIDTADPADLKDHIIQYELISEDDIDEVLSEKVRHKRGGLFLDKLMKTRKPGAFDVYCEVLNYAHGFVVKPLRETWKRYYEAEIEDGIKLSEEQLQSRPSDILLQHVSEHLGREWEPLAIRLGFTSANLYHIKSAHPYSPERAPFDMLIKWSQRDPEPTIAKLLSHLREIDVDDEVLEKVFVEKNLKI